MAIVRYIFAMLVAALLFSCQNKQHKKEIKLDSFAGLCDSRYAVDASAIRHNISRLLSADKDVSKLDRFAREYYSDGKPFLWITKSGITSKADSVLAYLENIPRMGFDKEKFCYTAIKEGLAVVRSLEFGQGRGDVNEILARLEYNLSKAYFRYCIGQRYGFVNPAKLFNSVDVRDSDSVRVNYRVLYDVKTKRPDNAFYAEACAALHSPQSAGAFLHSSSPHNNLFRILEKRLASSNNAYERKLVLCNMERCRWNLYDYPQDNKKYVLVNIPSSHLWAIDNDQCLTMRIGYGATDTKTPLITSKIFRMDFNPQWVIPKSIVKNSVMQHAGSNSYFESHNYYIYDRTLQKNVEPSSVSGAMLLDKRYRVVQRGGKGNALGRVIFRFDNDCAIFIHDTSNPGVFSKSDRSVSHGCVRVEKPYELAVFMLGKTDTDVLNDIKYAMTYDDNGDNGNGENGENRAKKKKPIGSLRVNPNIPVFITYYTMYPDVNGTLQVYDDVYGYDQLLYDRLTGFM